MPSSPHINNISAKTSDWYLHSHHLNTWDEESDDSDNASVMSQDSVIIHLCPPACTRIEASEDGGILLATSDRPRVKRRRFARSSDHKPDVERSSYPIDSSEAPKSTKRPWTASGQRIKGLERLRYRASSPEVPLDFPEDHDQGRVDSLLQAVEQGELAKVRYILMLDSSAGISDQCKRRAYNEAAVRGQEDIMQIFLELVFYNRHYILGESLLYRLLEKRAAEERFRADCSTPASPFAGLVMPATSMTHD